MQNKNSKISCDIYIFFCPLLINVLQMFFLSIPTGEVCPRFTAQGYSVQAKWDIPVSLRARGSSYTRGQDHFSSWEWPMTIFSEVFGSQNLGAICPSVLGAAGIAWQVNHASGQWLSIRCSVFWDKDHRVLCRSGVRQTVNWGSAWQIMQEIMIDVSGRAVWGA